MLEIIFLQKVTGRLFQVYCRPKLDIPVNLTILFVPISSIYVLSSN